jgi:hypothetical protein
MKHEKKEHQVALFVRMFFPATFICTGKAWVSSKEFLIKIGSFSRE